MSGPANKPQNNTLLTQANAQQSTVTNGCKHYSEVTKKYDSTIIWLRKRIFDFITLINSKTKTHEPKVLLIPEFSTT